MNLNITDEIPLTVQNDSTIVTCTEFIRLVQDGKVVAQLDAKFDMKDVAPQHQHIMIQLMNGCGRTLYLSNSQHYASKIALSKKNAKKKGFFKRMFSR